ncbi:DUF736 domain-containing protein [Dongia deserti]|uniref:DUF736 domain-containing protein n=1 Tax=Dongia deserti TaxID=2268030 RepID=UPI000E65CF58|nr:DUF736 domain-containing protein [Dongia deserti]
MAIIGTFTTADDGYVGTIETLACAPAPVRITRVRIKPNQQAPDYRVYRGNSEIGAAWAKTGKAGQHYLIVTLDDPAFATPIKCRLVIADAGFSLVWTR